MKDQLVDVDRAQITRTGDGQVAIDDPDSPLLIEMSLGVVGGRRQVTALTVSVRHPLGVISERSLRRLPIRQMSWLAHQQLATHGHPNEQFYWQLARQMPRQRGKAVLGREHFERVMTVFEWAQQTGRPGGGHQAVADMWGVTKAPTAYRWVRHARRELVAAVASAGDPAARLAGGVHAADELLP